VSAARPLCLCFFADPQLEIRYGCYIFSSNGAGYQFTQAGNDSYYLVAFLDIHINEEVDADEPFEIYRDRGALPADAVRAGDGPVDFVFGDENLPAAPTPTPVASCIGDCNGSGDVTIDEIILMVNVALGGGQLPSCAPGDANDSGNLAIDDIIRAVANAINGC
jgi:hypothetical protein